MKASLASADAWRAFAAQDYALAERIWLVLLGQAGSRAAALDCHLGYTRLLVAQQRFLEACALLQAAFDLSGNPRILGLLGELAPRCRRPVTGIRRLSRAQHLQAARQRQRAGLRCLGLTCWSAALQHAMASLAHARQAGDPAAEVRAHWLLADVMIAKREFEKARVCYRAAEQAQARLQALRTGSRPEH